MAFYAICVMGGPCLAPLIGAALTVNSHLGWRCKSSIFSGERYSLTCSTSGTMYMQAIITMTVLTLAVFCMPESYAPVLLKRKANRLRKTTGDKRYWHPHEDVKMNLDNIISKHFSRPLRMFFTEPMVTCICIYASFVYGLLFLCIEVFPIVFYQERSYSLVVSTLPFLGTFVGCLIAVGINIANQPFYIRAVQKAGKERAVPEARLPPLIIGGILLTTGLFWFGWTSAPKYHWALPVVAAGKFSAAEMITPSNKRCRFHRCRLQRHLPTVPELPRRHVRALCGLGNSCKHIPTIVACMWTAISSKVDVPESGRGPSFERAGGRLMPCTAHTADLHEIRRETPEDVEVRAFRR